MIQYSRDARDGIEKPRRTGYPAYAGYDEVPSQLARIGEHKRRHPPCVLIEDQGAGDRRLGALATVFAFAEPAVDADRRTLGFLQIQSAGIDELGGMADFATKPDRKTRLCLRVRRNLPPHHLRDREIAGAS